MQGHIGLRDRLRVEAWHLLQLGEGHDGLAAFSRRGGHQEGLLGGNGGGGQVWGPDLLCHQLLFDFVDQDEVVQLAGVEAERSEVPCSIGSPSSPNTRLTWLGMVGGGGQK